MIKPINIYISYLSLYWVCFIRYLQILDTFPGCITLSNTRYKHVEYSYVVWNCEYLNNGYVQDKASEFKDKN